MFTTAESSMLGIQMRPMSGQGYRRTNFDDEDTLSNGGAPPPVEFHPGSVFKGGLTLWQRKTPLQKLSLVFRLLLVLTIIVLASLLAAKQAQIQQLQSQTDVCLTPECVSIAASLVDIMDRSADPCDDFYQYACGGWNKSHPIPSGHARWGTFDKLIQRNKVVLKNAIEKPTYMLHSEAERKAQRYYFSCMDANKTIETLGAQPLLDVLRQYGGWPVSNSSGVWQADQWSLQTAAEKARLMQVTPLFMVYVSEDLRNSSRNILILDQAGLSLEQDHYLNKSIDDDKVLSAYLKYMLTTAKLLGAPDNNATSELLRDVIRFEQDIANITIPPEDRRDEEKSYHKMTIKEIQERYPLLDWLHYFNTLLATANLTVTSNEPVVVVAPLFLEQLTPLVNATLSRPNGRRAMSTYIAWHLVKRLSSYLSKPFRDAKKAFTDILDGVTGSDDLWRYCITDTDIVLGFAMGAMFVRDTFSGHSKTEAEKMISDVKAAFISNLHKLRWMDDDTRAAAIEKAKAVVDMIGFPEYILNTTQLDLEYDRLKVSEAEYFQNNIRNIRFELIRDMELLRKEPKINNWIMTPPTVNAYYAPTKNMMIFPAGILQRPFYDRDFPKSLNYGAMGVVMGHELTHGFDDQGREYDKQGNLRRWWRNETVDQFNTRAQCFVQQYSKFTMDGNHVKGRLTLGENIADNGGLKSAFHAYEAWIREHGEEQPLPGLGLSHRQLFFLAFSQVWCSTGTKESDLTLLQTDPHSPAIYRVRGTLSNSKDFARAFKCRPGSRMNPVNKCEVW